MRRCGKYRVAQCVARCRENGSCRSIENAKQEHDASCVGSTVFWIRRFWSEFDFCRNLTSGTKTSLYAFGTTSVIFTTLRAADPIIRELEEI